MMSSTVIPTFSPFFSFSTSRRDKTPTHSPLSALAAKAQAAQAGEVKAREELQNSETQQRRIDALRTAAARARDDDVVEADAAAQQFTSARGERARRRRPSCSAARVDLSPASTTILPFLPFTTLPPFLRLARAL